MNVYIRKAASVAVDERCICGHPKSAHGSSLRFEKQKTIRFHNKGNCCDHGCACSKFRWAGWIYEEVKEKVLAY